MNTKGKLIVISGFSGVGKGTVIRKLLKERSDFAFSISCTTRSPREGEADGREYFFLSREDFEREAREGHFLEYAQYSGQFYGTPAEPVFSMMNRGLHVILDLEFQGAFAVKEKVPDAMMFFLVPPSAQTLVERLCGRGTETDEQICRRLSQALTEADMSVKYEAILVNDDLTRTVSDILNLVENPSGMEEFYRRNIGTVQQIKSDLNGILKTW